MDPTLRLVPRSLLALSTIVATATVAQERPPVPPEARLEALVGEYEVEVWGWKDDEQGVTGSTGTATVAWSWEHERLVDEVELGKNQPTQPGSHPIGATTTWLHWQPDSERYELVHSFGPYAQILYPGVWDPDSARLVFISATALPEHRASTSPFFTDAPLAGETKWEIAFEADGFEKEFFEKRGGEWKLVQAWSYRSTERRGPRSTRIDGFAEVPMQGGSRYAIVEVGINGKGPFQLVLDTGASTTVLHADLVCELELESLGRSRIGDPSDPHANEVDELELDELTFGSATFTGVRAIGWGEQPLARMPGAPGVRGVLGLPTFADCLLTLDYPNRVVVAQLGQLDPPNGEDVLPMTLRGIPSFPIKVAGVEFEAHLDAGNAGSLVLPGEWEDKLKLVDGSKREGTGMRASGPVEFTIARLDGTVLLGDRAFDKPEIRFDFGLRRANVGYGLLNEFAVTLDQAHEKIRLTRVIE